LALCAKLAARGEQVLAACRSSSSELSTLPVEVVSGVDVTTQQGAEVLRRAVGSRSIGLLINNAGLLAHDALGSLDFTSIRRQFEVNALGPLRITEALVDRFAAGAKIALITSRMGSIEDNSSGSYYGYRMSKTALNMAGKSLALDLEPRGIAVAILHPGFVRTRMTGDHGGIDPAEAAHGLLERIDALTLATSGGFWHMNGERLPW
jgi:NAD(P)-dependent dehydrogenase (short-subunit alcohol dehydrogenase family)